MKLVITITVDVEEDKVRKAYGDPFMEEYLAILREEKIATAEQLRCLAQDAVRGKAHHGVDLGTVVWDVWIENPDV